MLKPSDLELKAEDYLLPGAGIINYISRNKSILLMGVTSLVYQRSLRNLPIGTEIKNVFERTALLGFCNLVYADLIWHFLKAIYQF